MTPDQLARARHAEYRAALAHAWRRQLAAEAQALAPMPITQRLTSLWDTWPGLALATAYVVAPVAVLVAAMI